MGTLEEAVKPVVEPMMHDHHVQLDNDSQRFVAAWCVKTAMVFECTRPTRPWFFEDIERDHLRSSLSIPPDTAVWLARRGRHDPDDVLGASASTLYTAMPECGLGVSKAYVNTLYAGSLILQTITIRPGDHNNPARYITIHAKPGLWDRSLIQTWPFAAELSWPPPLSFTGYVGLGFLTDRFTGPPR